ncbi:fused MFS/spermidine synthase [Geochorda subterranea]|uniref:Polyamine aminopropyltransferase n=1 Tax=Geochorda subterranea TaxID=3109564 RepID=A0ABZ1BL72_9FIRM|nr:fused MFS/spermidine synthase [Limnochorda sp. LNt]WRP13280.1 fused MFS/spermidine synthase [Limnochorda sp. LNt]
MLAGVVFLAGAVLMGLEMVGSRILAPYFGNSIYVWGSLISVVLAALTAGYFLGGRLADRRPHPEWMGWLIVAPGAFVSTMPLWAGPFNFWMINTGIGIREGSLLSALVLFFLPGLFLGTVSPYAIRLAAERLQTIGTTAGMLYAISTAGSIVGTLFTAFYLVAWLGVTHILYLFGGILVVLGLVVVIWGHRRGMAAAAERPASAATASRTSARAASRRAATGGRQASGRTLLWALVAVGVAAASLVAGLGSAGWTGIAQGRGEILYERDSVYHHILVVDDPGGIRYLKFDDSWQSAMDRERPDDLVFWYTRYFHVAMGLVPDARQLLMVGLGGGSVPKNFLATYRDLTMDVAELDPEVVAVAHRYFQVPLDDPRLRIVAEDGRLFVRRSPHRYDAIFLDAYFAHSIPFHLATVEFFEELEARLTPDGVVASNIIGALSGRHSLLFRSMLKSMQAVFDTVYVLPVGTTSGSAIDPVQRNIIVLATNQPALSPQAFQERIASLEREGRLPPGSSLYARSLVVEAISTGDVPLLTDDHAPVDTLLRI